MPCPPSYEEQRFGTVDLWISNARQWTRQLTDVVGLLVEVLEPTTTASASLRAEIARCVSRETPAPPAGWAEVEPIYGQGPVHAAGTPEFEALMAFTDPARVWARQAEDTLCEASCLLIQLSDHLGPLSDLQAWRLRDLSEKHRKHREGDRFAMIAQYDNAGRPDLVARVRAIPTDVLLRDRRCMEDLDD